MQNYPLSFSVSPVLSWDRIQVNDAAKNTLLVVPAVDDAMKNGQAPFPVYSDRDKATLAWQILAAKTGEDKEVFTISAASGEMLGKVLEVADGWEIQNYGGLVGQIKEKGAEKSCLGCLLSLLDIFGLIFFMIDPHRYEVQINGQPVLKLQQTDYNMADSFKLNKTGDFFEADETLLLLSLAAVLLN